jgi:hypothetical protein
LFTAGGNATVSISLGKDVEERDWIGVVAEERVNGVFEAKRSPDLPMLGLFLGVLFANAIVDGFLYKAKVSLEIHLVLRGQSLQEFVCGK